MFYLGIDISKSSFNAHLIKGEKRGKNGKFANTPEGFAELDEWLEPERVTKRVKSFV
ncbi:MAG: IS110 family transposase [Spirulina sp. SIO3F2]|nr:IS110 family transposase [Spirulina sp. SIO3F2]